LKTSFRRKPESSKFNYFWMPDQVRHDGFGTFYEIVKVENGLIGLIRSLEDKRDKGDWIDHMVKEGRVEYGGME